MRGAASISAVASILLSVWYMMAIVGIDIHVDHHDGKIFVVSMLSRTDCESLHPDDECHCLEHHRGLCNAEDEDCENLVNILSITGDGFHFACDFAPLMHFLAILESPVPALEVSDHSHSTCAFHAPPRALLNSLCVLRV